MYEPNKQEMLSFLKNQWKPGILADKYGFEDECEIAIYWFANDYHGGQCSNLYNVLCQSYYHPGRLENKCEENSMSEMLYNSLVNEFAMPQTINN